MGLQNFIKAVKLTKKLDEQEKYLDGIAVGYGNAVENVTQLENKKEELLSVIRQLREERAQLLEAGDLISLLDKLEKDIEKLNCKKAELNDELASLKSIVDEYQEGVSIIEQIEQLKEKLQTQRENKIYNTKDIYIASFTLPDYPEVYMGAFLAKEIEDNLNSFTRYSFIQLINIGTSEAVGHIHKTAGQAEELMDWDFSLSSTVKIERAVPLNFILLSLEKNDLINTNLQAEQIVEFVDLVESSKYFDKHTGKTFSVKNM